jgi:hypothetical protein
MEYLMPAPQCLPSSGQPRVPRHMGLIIRLIIQTIRRDRSGSDQIDEASNVSRPDPSGAEQIDAEHQATDLAVDSSRFLHASLSS